MHYFVTGATGFIGKRLVKALLARRGATVHFLLRPESEAKLADLYAYWGIEDQGARSRAVPVYGDLTARKLGVSADDIRKLKGHVDHVYNDHVSILKFIERNWRLPTVSALSRDNLPNPRPSEQRSQTAASGPSLGDLTSLFVFGENR